MKPFFASKKLRAAFGIPPVVIALDQWTKYLIHSRFRWGESLPIWPPVFDLTYVRNMGAAFGMFHGAPSAFREPFFLLVPLVALAVIGTLLYRLREDQWETACGLSLVIGGAVGNLIDRVRFGYVIDFLDVHWKEVYHWPAFNVADSCIVVGVALLFILSFRRANDRPVSVF